MEQGISQEYKGDLNIVTDKLDLEGENIRVVFEDATLQVKDTTGAGDAFFSGTVMALTKGMPLSEAVKYGSRLASLTISSDGSACPIMPDFFNEQLKLF